jgi:hypothetical protein
MKLSSDADEVSKDEFLESYNQKIDVSLLFSELKDKEFNIALNDKLNNWRRVYD